MHTQIPALCHKFEMIFIVCGIVAASYMLIEYKANYRVEAELFEKTMSVVVKFGNDELYSTVQPVHLLAMHQEKDLNSFINRMLLASVGVLIMSAALIYYVITFMFPQYSLEHPTDSTTYWNAIDFAVVILVTAHIFMASFGNLGKVSSFYETPEGKTAATIVDRIIDARNNPPIVLPDPQLKQTDLIDHGIEFFSANVLSLMSLVALSVYYFWFIVVAPVTDHSKKEEKTEESLPLESDDDKMNQNPIDERSVSPLESVKPASDSSNPIIKHQEASSSSFVCNVAPDSICNEHCKKEESLAERAQENGAEKMAQALAQGYFAKLAKENGPEKMAQRLAQGFVGPQGLEENPIQLSREEFIAAIKAGNQDVVMKFLETVYA
jgi:hypothetical protein